MPSSYRSERVTLRVAFHDCDPLGVVWHGHYLKYFELARTQLFASSDLDVAQVGDLGYRVYVVDVRCRYTHPLRYGDDVEVRAKTTADSPMLRISYSVRNLSNGRRSARGHTILAATNPAGDLLREVPAEILDRLRA